MMKDRKIAPGFEGGMAWLNVDRPVTMAELRGCVVVVDFWTYCCVNCMHVLPVLRALEERYAAEPLVVIGVHSGKFAAEQDPERIREAVGRYGVPHPVVVDDEMVIWGRFGVRSWPTLVVVRPDGTIAAVAPGEPDLETLDAFVRRELDAARRTGTLASARPRLVPTAPERLRPLRYPGKVRALQDGRIVISDTGHNRVLVTHADGVVDCAIGSGYRGHRDGRFDEAAFDDPQGCCWHDGALYIADARNHCIRRADLDRGVVETVAGTGRLGQGAPEGELEATATALRSPWALCSVGDAIYVAMAGNHQIWKLWPDRGTIAVYAGTGVEALIDGPVERSAWAQPSGLSYLDGKLYVADSETSAIRAIDFESGMVQTLVGLGLFDFGDDEGDATGAMLQHCLCVQALPGGLLIADTYNGKVKQLTFGLEHVGPSRMRTVLSHLAEPGGVALAPDGTWLVADTNAHRVVRVRDGRVEPVEVVDAPEPAVGALGPVGPATQPARPVAGWFTTIVEVDPSRGLGAGDGSVTLLLRAPPGFKLSEGSSIDVQVEVSRRSDLLLTNHSALSTPARDSASQLVAIDVRVGEFPEPRIEAELVASASYVLCDEEERRACHPGRIDLRVPVRLLRSGDRELALEVPLPDPAEG